MGKHRTTETLRDHLFVAIERVMEGTMERDAAMAVARLSDSIVTTVEAETRHALALSTLDKHQQDVTPGKLLLTQESREGE